MTKFNLESVEQLIKNNLIHVKDYGDHKVLKYSRKAFFDQSWEQFPILEEIRGLVLDKHNNIMAYPFTKIYNRFQNKKDVPLDEEIQAVQKLNGFMGTVSVHDDKFVFSTTGSTDSEYASWLEIKFWETVKDSKRIEIKNFIIKNNLSLMFEVVDQQLDPHIINDDNGLYLIGARNKSIGSTMYKEIDLDHLAKTYEFKRPKYFNITFRELLKLSAKEITEGWVIRDLLTGQPLLKLKSDYYLAAKLLMRKKSHMEQLFDDKDHFIKSMGRDINPTLVEMIYKLNRRGITKKVWTDLNEQERRKVIEGMYGLLKFNKSYLYIIRGLPGAGKEQPLSSKIKIPGGWTTMGEIKVGDLVDNAMGGYSPVSGVYPQGVKDIYRITFEDGRVAECGLEHLWNVTHKVWKQKKVNKKNINITSDDVYKTISLEEIIRLKSSKGYGNRFYIPLSIINKQDKDIDLPLNSYLLGALIGDGGLTNSSIKFTTADNFIKEKIKHIVNNYDCVLNTTGGKYDYRISKTKSISNPIKNELNKLGLIGKRSYEKSIPEIYLNSSYQQRLELLQGLMDTDGTIGSKGSIQYCTTSEQLAKDIQYLVRSIGGLCKISTRIPKFTYKGIKKEGRLAYILNIRISKQTSLFSLPRKLERCNDDNQYSKNLKLRIKSVELVGNDETRCIMVDSPDHLYITDNFIVTHNTTFATKLSKHHFEADQYFINDLGEYKFDATKLKEVHHQCHMNTIKHLLQNKTVVVSNTFTTEKEMENYLKFSKGINIPFTVLIVENRNETKSIHNVPEETLDKMKTRFEIKL